MKAQSPQSNKNRCFLSLRTLRLLSDLYGFDFFIEKPSDITQIIILNSSFN
jgi:hypothetical protein